MNLVNRLVGLLALALLSTLGGSAQDGDAFRRQQRPGSVDIDTEYDLSGITIPKEQIHTLLPRDAIPSLTDPNLEPVADADWLLPSDRIIVVTVGNNTVGVPLRMLDRHEVVNLTVGDQPLAITYCPLCDSAAVFSRRVNGKSDTDQPIILSFGVSGALFNSNVLIYDRRDRGLWSQLGMRAVSGPLVGTALTTMPFQVITMERMRTQFADASVISPGTRTYRRNPYASYFSHDRLMVPVRKHGTAMARKTLGIGIVAGDQSWFVPMEVIGKEYSLQTPDGPVVLRQSAAGTAIMSKPDSVRTAQSFYYSWTAFYPDAIIVSGPEEASRPLEK